ncbi:unnamed protein product, partial [Ixodes hexagonus]
LFCLVSRVLAGDRFVGPSPGQAGLGAPGFASVPQYAEENYPAQPYSFGYDNVDEYGNTQFHKEQADANNVRTGSYGYTDANGLYRRVNYVADANGFRATIETNEPGTQAGASADAVFNAKPVVVAPIGPQAPGAYGARVYAKPSGLGQGQPGYAHAGHDKGEHVQAGYGQAGYGQGGYAN